MTYSPLIGYKGKPGRFPFRVFDGTSYSNVATVTVTVRKKRSLVYVAGSDDGCSLSRGDQRGTPFAWYLPLALVLLLGAGGRRVFTGRRQER